MYKVLLGILGIILIIISICIPIFNATLFPVIRDSAIVLVIGLLCIILSKE